jgi:nucleoside phosphorylase
LKGIWQAPNQNNNVKYKIYSRMKQKIEIDVLLVCALKDEYQEVLKVRDGIIEDWSESKDASGRIIADGKFASVDGRSLHVRTTWTSYMGREQSQAVTSAILKDCSVKCLAMSGICAGRRGKVALGDVIFAERLWSYDVGKLVVDGEKECFQADMLQYRPAEPTVQHMQNLCIANNVDWLETRPNLPFENQEDWVLRTILKGESPLEHKNAVESCPDWLEVINRLWQKHWVSKDSLELTDLGKKYITKSSIQYSSGLPKPKEFEIHVAPLASGAKVMEDEGIFPKLSGSMRKVLGLDMEASGLAALSEAHTIPIIVAKAVSDYGDMFKDDRYRQFAARASAETLILLLRETAHLFLTDNQQSFQGSSQKETPQARIVSSQELVDELANLFPDLSQIRSLWERAGGNVANIANIPRPRDMWQNLWKCCLNGGQVKPENLLTKALEEYPNNNVFLNHLN